MAIGKHVLKQSVSRKYLVSSQSITGCNTNGTRPYVPPRMRIIVIEQSHDFDLGVQATEIMMNLMS